MNYCENCGTQFDYCDEFCTECGAKREEHQEYISNKFCEECGAEIEKGDFFCTECGQNNCANRKFLSENHPRKANDDSFALPSCELSEVLMIANELPQTEKEINETQKSKTKVTAIVLIAIIAVLIVSLGLMMYFYFNDEKSNRNNAPAESITEPTTSESTFKSTTKEPTAQLSKPTLRASDYLGYWHINMSNERELTIHNIEGNQAEFSLWYYRFASIENIIANIDGNVASFSNNDNGSVIKGILIFNEFSVTVSITASELTYMPVETMTFDSRHKQSWEYYGFETGESAVYDQGSALTGKVSFSDPASYLNVRSGPGTDNSILKDKNGKEVHLSSGQSVSILGEYNSTDNGTKKWYKVAFAYGDAALTGYVRSDYITNKDELVAPDYVTNRPKLGITYSPISQSIIVQSNGLPLGSIIIREIESKSDLNNKGVQLNDLIIAANGEELTLTNTLEKIIEFMDVGDTITLTICRVNIDYTINTSFDVKVKLI